MLNMLDVNSKKETMKLGSKPKRTLYDVMEEQKRNKEHSQQSKDDIPEYLKKEKSLNYAVKDSVFVSIKTGFTESFIMPLAIAMNATSGMLSVLASVPELVAAF